VLENREKPAVSQDNSLLESLGKLLRGIGEARVLRRLTVEEALIFLAVGYLGISETKRGTVTITPISCVDIAAILGIPRETVRRKATALAIRKLVSVTARGIVIVELDQWRDFAEEILR
jgi:mannose/fructose/N-acetylgalactosamine-specific phosphotransferase system component IIC